MINRVGGIATWGQLLLSSVGAVAVTVAVNGAAVCIFLGPERAQADSSESIAQLKNQMIDRWVDFENLQKRLVQDSKGEMAARDALVRTRQEAADRQEALRKQYVESMSRYSMDEVERAERLNEQMQADADLADDVGRRRYIDRRDTLRDLEAKIGRIDPLIENDIDMVIQPEFKSSWTDWKPSTAGEGRESF